MFLRLFFSIGLVGCLLLNTVLGTEPETIPDGYELFENIQKSVQAIHAGQVRVENSAIEGNLPPIKMQWTISFDKDKKRADVFRNGHKDYLCYNCYDKMTRLFYTTLPPPVADSKMALVFTDADNPETGRHLDYIPDPRWFGFIPIDISNSQHYSPPKMYDTSIKRRQSEVLSVISEKFSGIDCWRVDYAMGIVNHSIWLNKSNHYNVVCVENRFVSDNVQFVDRVQTTGALYEGNIWFPKKLNYKRTENGVTTCSEETTIEVISLNKPLPPDTFSPKTIVKPDTPVAWHLNRDRPFPEGELAWDGEKIVVVDRFSPMINNPPEFGWTRIVLILIGLALIFLGIGLKLRKRYL
ncbi:MAG: hypothetical protein LBG58_06410 [Planctomycetaceae bacterium]|jgi:hypothetical protein|nr:hypothetical protein [Planctomycetaceae bacterium]